MDNGFYNSRKYRILWSARIEIWRFFIKRPNFFNRQNLLFFHMNLFQIFNLFCYYTGTMLWWKGNWIGILIQAISLRAISVLQFLSMRISVCKEEPLIKTECFDVCWSRKWLVNLMYVDQLFLGVHASAMVMSVMTQYKFICWCMYLESLWVILVCF